jgi:N utilization substance protein B
VISDRRRARQIAMQALFECDQTAHDPVGAVKARADEDGLGGAMLELATNLVRGVVDNKEQIDEIIVQTAAAWPLEQIAATDRVALELGVYEVQISQETPVEVAINEAVELAKIFGGENSAAFVNGVLRTVVERNSTPSHT